VGAGLAKPVKKPEIGMGGDRPVGIRLDIPDSVTKAIRLPEPSMRDDLLVELALALYGRGVLGFGKARELADLPKLEFGRLLGSRGIPRQYGPEDLADDLEYACR
jgi:predicted HTH domain antitoxin